MKLFQSLTVAGALFAASTLSASTIYNVDYVLNAGTDTAFSVTGTIATDGTLGAITLNNVSAVNLTVTTIDGTYTADQLTDVNTFNVTATSSDLLLMGDSKQNFTLSTDTSAANPTGVMFQLCYDPQGIPSPLDSIYIQKLPTGGYYDWSATSLSPISLDPSAAAATAPEPAGIGMTALAGFLLIGCSRLRSRRENKA